MCFNIKVIFNNFEVILHIYKFKLVNVKNLNFNYSYKIL